MGRKNRRREVYVPLDLTPAQVRRAAPVPDGMTIRERRDLYWERENEREERQRQARIARGIDWSVCLVPGCGEELILWGIVQYPDSRRRDPSLELPICYKHSGVLWRQLARLHAADPKFIEAIADVREQVAAREERLRKEDHVKHMARTDGHIYFIRLGDLVKVGWTRDLAQRLKSYGASAELLAAYDGTRDDETNLHRQLRPALAKGREWYADGDIIQHFIDEALAKYGMPPTLDFLWTQPKQVVAGKRAMRYRN